MMRCLFALTQSRPKLKIAFSVDKPVAQITARLCDVSPDGVSQRITYRPLNLCHYQSHQSPEHLVPGKVYEAEIQLNECAHRLLPGHVLRLALSSSYWPIVWPAGENAVISLHLENCALSLPVRHVQEEITPANPGPASAFETLKSEKLRKAESKSARTMGQDGTVVLETYDDYGKTRDPYHGLIVGSHVHMHYAIHPDDPASAMFETSWNFTFERGDWQVEINTSGKMTCDRQNFYLHQKLHATEGADKTEVFTKEWTKTIPRGLL
jgi:hypothetical protein